MSTVISLRSERYEVAFNRIHLELKKLVKNEAPHFVNLVYKGSKMFSLIQKYQEELHQFARLRNAIVHDKYDLGEYIAEPHEETVQRIEEIANIFSKPSNALSIATRNVITYHYEDSIEKVIKGIQKYSYSQYPIYKDRQCIGLLTAKAVVSWMALNVSSSIVDLSEVKVKDMVYFEKDYALSFAPETINIFELEKMFVDAHLNKQILEAVLITKNGESDEQPLGLVTSWDLIEMDYKFN